MKSITKKADIKIEHILELSKKKGNTDKIFIEFIKHHAEEIEELYNKGDKHYAVETGDMIILCIELLKNNNINIDDILKKCYGRFEDKLK